MKTEIYVYGAHVPAGVVDSLKASYKKKEKEEKKPPHLLYKSRLNEFLSNAHLVSTATSCNHDVRCTLCSFSVPRCWRSPTSFIPCFDIDIRKQKRRTRKDVALGGKKRRRENLGVESQRIFLRVAASTDAVSRGIFVDAVPFFPHRSCFRGAR